MAGRGVLISLAVMLHSLAAFPALLSAQVNWALDAGYGEDGHCVVETGGWEWPVALEHNAVGLRVWGQVYDASGEVSSHGWQMNGAGDWTSSVDLASGGEVVDAVGDVFSWVLSKRSWSVPDSAGLPAPQTSIVIESWDGDALRPEFGSGTGLVDLQFVGPVQTPTACALFGGWLAVAGHGLDSCCAHAERPVLAVLDAETGGFRAGFGVEGRVALDLVNWILQDSVRHESSGVFYDVAFDVMPSGDTVLYACGGYQAQSYLQPMVARIGLSGAFAGALDTTFGVGGIATLDLNPLHNLMAVSLQPNAAAGPGTEMAHVSMLLRADGGGDYAEALYLLQLDIDGQPIALLESGAPPPSPPAYLAADPVRSLHLLAFGAAELWGFGTAGDDLNYDGQRRPAAFQFTDNLGAAPTSPTWWADTAWASQSLGPAIAQGDTLWLAGALYDSSSPWSGDPTAALLSKWVRTETSNVLERAPLASVLGSHPNDGLPDPYPNPSAGAISWQLPPGLVQLRDPSGRLVQSWAHPGGLFNCDLTHSKGGRALLAYIGGEKSGGRCIILSGGSPVNSRGVE